MDLYRVGRFFRLPSITTLNLQAAGLNGSCEKSRKTWESTRSFLRHISIDGASNGAGQEYQIEALCASCTTLESFRLLHHGYFPGLFIMQATIIALQPALKRSLKLLDLCGSYQDGQTSIHHSPHERAFEVLREATCLEELHLDWEASLWPGPWNDRVQTLETRLELPATLQILHLRCSIVQGLAAAFTEYLRTLSQDMQLKQPRLRDVIVEFAYPDLSRPPYTLFDMHLRQTLEASLKALKPAFVECNVSFDVTFPDSIDDVSERLMLGSSHD